MICVQAPSGALPMVGAFLPPELMIVGHLNRDHDSVGTDDRVTWYVTPADPTAARATEAPDDARAEVEPAVVAKMIEGLLRFYPRIRDEPVVRLTAFAGWKQDIGEEQAVRICELVEGTPNVILALPSVLINAWPNASDVVTLVGKLTRPRGTARDIPHAGRNVRVGEVDELASYMKWFDWGGFSRAYAVAT